MAGSRRLARRNAVQALYQWELTGQAAPDIEASLPKDDSFNRADRDYFRALVAGVTAQCEKLDAQLAPHLQRDAKLIDPTTRAILRLAAHELSARPEVPTATVINEAVELSKLFGEDKGFQFVNGVLDELGREMRSGGAD